MGNGSKAAKYARLGLAAVAATVVAAEASACEFESNEAEAEFIETLNSRIAASDGGAIRVETDGSIYTIPVGEGDPFARGLITTDNEIFSSSFCAGEYTIGSGSEA